MNTCEAMDMIDRLNAEHDETFQENVELRKEIKECRETVISIKKENKTLRNNWQIKSDRFTVKYEELSLLNEQLSDIIKDLDGDSMIRRVEEEEEDLVQMDIELQEMIMGVRSNWIPPPTYEINGPMGPIVHNPQMLYDLGVIHGEGNAVNTE